MHLVVNAQLRQHAHHHDCEESEALLDAYNHAVHNDAELWSDELQALAYDLCFYLVGQRAIYLTDVDTLVKPDEIDEPEDDIDIEAEFEDSELTDV